MINLDDTVALVYTHADLSEAISNDNGIDYVYLCDNIIMTSGIRVHSAKVSLVIDGYYPPVSTDIRTISDSGTSTGQINVNDSPSLNLTFQNLVIAGRNFYGMPRVYEYSGAENVTVTYDKVTYSGPQMIYHTYGLTRFLDCEITIMGSPSADVHEVGEVCKVEIGGDTVINKMNTDHSVFWFYGNSSRRTSFKILSGANVTITTANYFMYEYYPPDYTIETGASLVLNTRTGISFDIAHTAASFHAGSNSTFKYTQSANVRNRAAIYIDGALMVDEGAKFYMQADFSNTAPLIWFTGGSAGLTVNNARSFALYNRGSQAATAFRFGPSIPFVFAGNQVNCWVTSTAFPSAGTLDDPAPLKWNRPNRRLFRLEGRAENDQTSVDFNDFTPEELEALPDLSEMRLHQAPVFSVGNLPLSVNPIVLGNRPITGKTESKARVRVSCVSLGPFPDCDADDSGAFSSEQTSIAPFAETFTVMSNTPFLITVLAAESLEEGLLYILEAPERIQFTVPPLAGFAETILPRRAEDTNVRVIISDTRDERTEWVIWARITGPLQAADNHTLVDGVVFCDQDGVLLTLGAEFVPVHTDGPYEDIDTPVAWIERRGVLARISVPIRSGQRYTTRLEWVVCPTGVPPDIGNG